MKHNEPKKIEQVNKPKQYEPSKEVKHELKGRCFICNKFGHMKRDFIGKSFKTITNLYCYNCCDYGHKEVDCKKPKFDSNNANSRMFRNTNPLDNGRGRSQRRFNDGARYNGERKHVVCYKCNNPRHIARNCKALENHNGTMKCTCMSVM